MLMWNTKSSFAWPNWLYAVDTNWYHNMAKSQGESCKIFVSSLWLGCPSPTNISGLTQKQSVPIFATSITNTGAEKWKLYWVIEKWAKIKFLKWGARYPDIVLQMFTVAILQCIQAKNTSKLLTPGLFQLVKHVSCFHEWMWRRQLS